MLLNFDVPVDCCWFLDSKNFLFCASGIFRNGDCICVLMSVGILVTEGNICEPLIYAALLKWSYPLKLSCILSILLLNYNDL